MTSAEPAKASLPRHVAIIMDGNGRWARKRHLPRAAGHVAGVSAVRDIVRAATDIGLENLTLYAFSSENWKRPRTEVSHLMGLFRAYFRDDVDELVERNVRVRIIGSRARADRRYPGDDRGWRAPHRQQHRLNLTFAFDYGAQEEIAAAARSLAEAAARGELDPSQITPEFFSAQLLTRDLPGPRPHHPHQRRAAAQQFPLVAGGLCRAAVRRHAVARFHARPVSGRAERLRPARAPLRRRRPEAVA